MSFSDLQESFNNALKEKYKNKTLSNADLKNLFDKAADTFPEVTDEIATTLYDSLIKIAPTHLQEWHSQNKEFEERHYELWKEGFNILESYLWLSYELGEAFNVQYRDEAVSNKDLVFDVLVRLQARAVHVGFEVLTLLRAGFADGAHGRWRTAHEIAVVVNFIAKHGQDAARLYLEHQHIESYKAMSQFQEYAESLGYQKFSEAEMNDALKLRDQLLEKNGKEFNSQYGWASNILNNRHPKFSDIEKATNLEHFRPYYKMACHNVHAGPKGILYRLGLPDNADIILVGRSNFGLTEPAEGIAISVLQATVPMFLKKISVDSVVWGKVMKEFRSNVGKAFHKVQQKMEEAGEPYHYS